jgi:hypothetical protein
MGDKALKYPCSADPNFRVWIAESSYLVTSMLRKPPAPPDSRTLPHTAAQLQIATICRTEAYCHVHSHTLESDHIDNDDTSGLYVYTA